MTLNFVAKRHSPPKIKPMNKLNTQRQVNREPSSYGLDEDNKKVLSRYDTFKAILAGKKLKKE